MRWQLYLFIRPFYLQFINLAIRNVVDFNNNHNDGDGDGDDGCNRAGGQADKRTIGRDGRRVVQIQQS